MESLLFVVVGVALYLAADRVLGAVEAFAGHRLEHRTVLFFLILLLLSLGTFALLRHILPLT